MLTDHDLRLRPFGPDDRDPLVELADNPKVSRFLADRFPCPYRLEDADAWLDLVRDEHPLQHPAIEWQGRLVGGIGFEGQADIHRGTGVLGYWLGEPYWGRGLAVRATNLFVPYVWAHFPLIRLQAEIFIDNPRSGRVLEACGFTREGVLRNHITKHGRITDAVLYGLPRPS